MVAGKVVIEPFTGIEFEQEKQIDEIGFHLHATAVRCMLGKVFTLTLDKLWAISKVQSSCSICTLKTGASSDVSSPTCKETVPACIDSYDMSHFYVLQFSTSFSFAAFFCFARMIWSWTLDFTQKLLKWLVVQCNFAMARAYAVGLYTDENQPVKHPNHLFSCLLNLQISDGFPVFWSNPSKVGKFYQ